MFERTGSLEEDKLCQQFYLKVSLIREMVLNLCDFREIRVIRVTSATMYLKSLFDYQAIDGCHSFLGDFN